MRKPGQLVLKKSPTLGLPGNTTSTEEEDFKETETLPCLVIFSPLNLHRQIDQLLSHNVKRWNPVQSYFSPKTNAKD